MHDLFKSIAEPALDDGKGCLLATSCIRGAQRIPLRCFFAEDAFMMVSYEFSVGQP
jgi:hypothetical protein